MTIQEPNSITIQSPTEGDLKDIILMYNKSWVDTYKGIQPEVTEEYLQKVTSARLVGEGYKRQLDALIDGEKNKDRFYRIAKNNKDRVIGLIDGKKVDGEYELERLYVDKSVLGKGTAQKLLQSFLEWIDEAGAIRLTVVEGNERAKSFYRKHGFVEIPGTKRVYDNGIMIVVDMLRKGEA